MPRFGWILLPLVWGCQNPPNDLPYPLTITPEGIGPIHLGAPFDLLLLRGKLPGFELEKLSEVTSAKGQTIIRLKRHNKPIALIVSDAKGDTLREVIILSPLIKNTQGLGINDILPLSERLHCIEDQCRYANETTILYRTEPHTRTIREITLQQL